MNYSNLIKSRRAFTLIELLMVIAIVGVLSSLTLAVMAAAQNDAKEAATRSRIRQIEAILAIELEDYEVRRIPVSVGTLLGYVNTNKPDADGDGFADNALHFVRQLKRRILQDMISAEMPRPKLDAGNNFIYNPDVGQFPTTETPVASGGRAVPVYEPTVSFADWLDAQYPTPAFAGGLTLRALLTANRPAKVQTFNTRIAATGNTAFFNLPGEYLYEILSRIDVEGESGIELLGTRVIGNSDDDMFPEVVDAWGDPMLLRIWQIGAEPGPDFANDVYEDVKLPGNPNVHGHDFDILDGAFPQGYTVIDPTVPREVSQIRFEVTSLRMGRRQ